MESIFQENNFIILIVIGILIMLAFAMAFVLFVNYSQKKILKEQMRIQKLDYKHQEELLHATILTQEKERNRIARDLHDEIGSKLNVIFLNICRLKKHGKKHEEIDLITNEVESVIHTTINSIRFISHELLPPTLEEFGLIETIRELQYSYNKSGDVHIDFTTSEKTKPITNSLIELNLFRVIQELINNSIRHGKATEIDMHLSAEETAIKLHYEDNGTGFDSSQKNYKKGLGMKNIESRLRIINATYTLNSSIENGTNVVIDLIPIPSDTI
ncbi:sensor histidine kinase [uncultured Kordia sp.]|uniref:sensor histidine kinase n=1 Tax=uncultured Kordia sp. TaxID=507699 RepID=UPI00262D0CBE|nr:sensor histidine kinase [uncultured Kordia sp.]